jgi:hypothetical protein
LKIIIDIGHPAHVHLFKNFTWEMQKRGHEILFTCRDKEFVLYLLNKYRFNYTSFGKKYISKFRKLYGLIKFDINELIEGIKFKPDVFLSHGSIYAAHAAFLLRKPHISLEDTFNFEQVNLYKPFTETILVSDYNHPLKSYKNISYAGYHELAYLHPNRFVPDENVLKELGMDGDEKYIVIRFVAWNATHDSGCIGISKENKIRAVHEFKKYSQVFITSEANLPEELSRYEIKIDPNQMHDVIAFSSLMFGDSSTMAEEAAILGVPSVYVSGISTYYTKHLENQYKLMFNFSDSAEDQLQAINKGIELLKTPEIKCDWKKRKEKMLSERIDVTEFLVWFIENYPKSFRIMKKNPDYQYRFK